MRKIVIAALAILAASAAQAQSRYGLETYDEQRQRIGAERQRQYEERRQAPLGGYRDRLADPAPYGTPQPGFNPPYQPYGADAPYSRRRY